MQDRQRDVFRHEARCVVLGKGASEQCLIFLVSSPSSVDDGASLSDADALALQQRLAANLKHLQSHFDVRDRRLHTCRTENAALHKQLTERDAHIRALASRSAASQNDAADANERLKSLSKRAQQMQAQMEEANAHIVVLETRMHGLADTLTARDAEVKP